MAEGGFGRIHPALTISSYTLANLGGSIPAQSTLARSSRTYPTRRNSRISRSLALRYSAGGSRSNVHNCCSHTRDSQSANTLGSKAGEPLLHEGACCPYPCYSTP